MTDPGSASTAAADYDVGFLGAGQMALALAKGFLAADQLLPSRLIASDVSPAARENFAAMLGATVVDSNTAVVQRAKMVWLAVKPQQLAEVLGEIRPHLSHRPLVVSIAAGVSLTTLEQGLGHQVPVIRVMPNTPALIGMGASAYALGTLATSEHAHQVQSLLATVGLAAAVPEKLLDAVTGLSGSGPAFVYQFIEALSDGGVRAGLPRELATRLAAQTVAGAASMVLRTGQHPGTLKDAVTSPGGTTIAGLHELERGALRGTVMDAVWAATQRAIELGHPTHS